MKSPRKSLLYSEEIGIDLSQDMDKELFKWSLANIVFGARITETIAKNTYKASQRISFGAVRMQAANQKLSHARAANSTQD